MKCEIMRNLLKRINMSLEIPMEKILVVANVKQNCKNQYFVNKLFICHIMGHKLYNNIGMLNMPPIKMNK